MYKERDCRKTVPFAVCLAGQRVFCMSALCACIIGMHSVYVCYMYIARIPLMRADLRRVSRQSDGAQCGGREQQKTPCRKQDVFGNSFYTWQTSSWTIFYSPWDGSSSPCRCRFASSLTIKSRIHLHVSGIGERLTGIRVQHDGQAACAGIAGGARTKGLYVQNICHLVSVIRNTATVGRIGLRENRLQEGSVIKGCFGLGGTRADSGTIPGAGGVLGGTGG